jgi:hypothetical protein
VPDSFPEMSQGDIETATIFTRGMRKIQSKFAALVSDISTNTSDIADNTANNNRAALLAQATLTADFANNKYELYDGPVDSLTVVPFGTMFTYIRASAATARTAIQTLEAVSTDQQRLIGNREGLLVEEERTNLFLNSDTLSTQDVTVAAKEYTLHFTGTGTITLSGTFTGSLVGTGAGEANRVSVPFTPTAGTLTATVTGSVVNAQLEQGSFPTSYIPTAGTQVTRAVDDCVRVLGDEFNRSEFTLFVKFKYVGGEGVVIGTEDASTSPIVFSFGNQQLYLDFNAAGGSSYGTGFNLIEGTNYQFAYRFKDGVASFFADGVFVASHSDTGIGFTNTTLFSLGYRQGVGTVLGTVYENFEVFPTAFPDAELITLTGGN